MLFELTTLSCPLPTLGDAAERARGWVSEASAGTLLGCWRTELGTLGRVLVLRGFDAPEDMTAERRRALFSEDPFHGGGVVTAVEMDSYAPFAFLPPIRTGGRGPVYEFRTYRQKPGGLPRTQGGWKVALGQARDYTAHLVTTLYALDGPPRITHIWAFDSLVQRAKLRAEAYAAGVWPPPGGPEQIAEATASIALPEDFSPLH